MTLRLALIVLGLSLIGAPRTVHAEDDDTPYSSDIDNRGDDEPLPAPSPGAKKKKGEKSRKYFVPDTNRTDAGIFHVAFAAGGNFYIEPKISSTTRAATGDYFKDFGFQGGAYFDYDYSAMTENIPLGLRGFAGYKYILNSVHVFAFDALARYMIRMSDHSTFGLGIGGSAAVWYRATTDTSDEEIIFLPSFIMGAGFEFTPFMVDFKWLLNRVGSNATIMGFELYFGVRI